MNRIAELLLVKSMNKKAGKQSYGRKNNLINFMITSAMAAGALKYIIMKPFIIMRWQKVQFTDY